MKLYVLLPDSRLDSHPNTMSILRDGIVLQSFHYGGGSKEGPDPLRIGKNKGSNEDVASS